jgi:hypothetical protein
LRSRVWLHRRGLDAELAGGVAPNSRPDLALRAEQLLSRRNRRSFAAGITRIIGAAEEPWNPRTAAVPVMRTDILASRHPLTEVANLLRSDEELELRGLAMLEPFLTAGESPLFNPRPEETLEHTVGRIRAALLLH